MKVWGKTAKIHAVSKKEECAALGGILCKDRTHIAQERPRNQAKDASLWVS